MLACALYGIAAYCHGIILYLLAYHEKATRRLRPATGPDCGRAHLTQDDTSQPRCKGYHVGCIRVHEQRQRCLSQLR